MKTKRLIRISNTDSEQQTSEGVSAHARDPSVRPQKILVPTDFSDSARKALRYAISLSGQTGSEIVLLHVVEPVPPPAEMIVAESVLWNNQLQEEATRQLARWKKDLGRKIRNQTVVRAGSAYREIVEAADELGADLIVLGTHGRTGLAHLLMGSTAERVVRHARCPVLVVRERQSNFVKSSEGTTLKTEHTKGEDDYGNRIKEKRSRKGRAVLR
jgi:nucleotide-binding universal stress UspA family protein